MSNYNYPTIMRQKLFTGFHKAKQLSKNTWVRLGVLTIFLFFLSQKNFSFSISMGDQDRQTAMLMDPGTRGVKATPASFKEETPTGEAPAKVNSSPKPTKTNKAPQQKWWEEIRENSADIRKDLNLANAATAVSNALSAEEQKLAAKYNNLGLLLNPGFVKKHKIPASVVKSKQQICDNYIQQYLKTAREEAELFNIPVSITLGQGLLESNAGYSRLARNDNNHFGIKCRKKCLGCRCANYTDDSKYDMFRIFETAWFSFREHSKLLTGGRYKHLTKLDRSDYKNWAHGLKAAGYATDKRYAEKLIQIIEVFELYKYDQ